MAKASLIFAKFILVNITCPIIASEHVIVRSCSLAVGIDIVIILPIDLLLHRLRLLLNLLTIGRHLITLIVHDLVAISISTLEIVVVVIVVIVAISASHHLLLVGRHATLIWLCKLF